MGQAGPVVLGGFQQVASCWLPVAVASVKWILESTSESSRNPPCDGDQSLVLLTETALFWLRWIPGGFPGEIA